MPEDVSGEIKVKMMFEGEEGPPAAPISGPETGGPPRGFPLSSRIEQQGFFTLAKRFFPFLALLGGVAGIAEIAKQSKIMGSMLEASTSIVGALVDTILAPLIPLLLPVLIGLAKTVEGLQKLLGAKWEIGRVPVPSPIGVVTGLVGGYSPYMYPEYRDPKFMERIQKAGIPFLEFIKEAGKLPGNMMTALAGGIAATGKTMAETLKLLPSRTQGQAMEALMKTGIPLVELMKLTNEQFKSTAEISKDMLRGWTRLGIRPSLMYAEQAGRVVPLETPGISYATGRPAAREINIFTIITMDPSNPEMLRIFGREQWLELLRRATRERFP